MNRLLIGLFCLLGIFLLWTFSTKDSLEGPKNNEVTLSETLDSDSPNELISIPCRNGSSRADIPGKKVWCWKNLADEINTIGALESFSSKQLAKSVHYDGKSVLVSNDRLHFNLNPIAPKAENNRNNYRSEIREEPSDVDHELGTEQWYGWDYRFDDNYRADNFNEWILWQVHGSFKIPENPLVSLWVAKENMAKHTNSAGEIFVVNAAIRTGNAKYIPTGIVPTAGQTLRIVVHLIWGDENNGLYEVWVDGKKIYSEQERTVYKEQPKGGYAKWGIYKWKWKKDANIAVSANVGITDLKTSMGTLRSVIRRKGDSNYRENAYDFVAEN